MAITRYNGLTPVAASTVTVYRRGTQDLATLYADVQATPLGNPFTSDTLTGYYSFWAAFADYDVFASGSGIPLIPSTATFNFATLAVPGGAVVAFQPGDAMQFLEGANITLTADPILQTITIAAAGSGSGTGSVTHTGALTANRLILGNGGVDVIAAPAGTATQVLHGNASGAPSFGPVALADLATQADQTILANLSGGVAVPAANTLTQLATAMQLVEVPFAADAVLDVGKAFLDLAVLTSAPAAPSAGYGRLYMLDVGGKVQFTVRFPSGAAQAIKTEI